MEKPKQKFRYNPTNEQIESGKTGSPLRVRPNFGSKKKSKPLLSPSLDIMRQLVTAGNKISYLSEQPKPYLNFVKWISRTLIRSIESEGHQAIKR